MDTSIPSFVSNSSYSGFQIESSLQTALINCDIVHPLTPHLAFPPLTPPRDIRKVKLERFPNLYLLMVVGAHPLDPPGSPVFASILGPFLRDPNF